MEPMSVNILLMVLTVSSLGSLTFLLECKQTKNHQRLQANKKSPKNKYKIPKSGFAITS